MERIAKVIARAGLCSRREAERWIADGRVRINGEITDSPAVNVSEGDEIIVDGNPLPEAQETQLWLFHKPAGIITTRNDPQNRTTIFDILPENLPRVISVGRLDLNSEGLLLLTNNGELARYLELPENALERKYRVRVFGQVDEKKLAALKDGITIKDPENGEKIRYAPIKARIEKTGRGRNSWLLFTLQEGRNREIRKICQHMGLSVNRLIRISYGDFHLGNLPVGGVRKAPQKIVKTLIFKAI